MPDVEWRDVTRYPTISTGGKMFLRGTDDSSFNVLEFETSEFGPRLSSDGYDSCSPRSTVTMPC